MEYKIGDVIEDHRGHYRTIESYKDKWNGREFWWTKENPCGLRYYDIKRVLEKNEIDKINNTDKLCREKISKLNEEYLQSEKVRDLLRLRSNSLHKEMMDLRKTLILDM